MNDIFESSDYLARLLAKYALLEVSYLQPDRGAVDGTKNLGDSIVKVYVSILRYASKVKSSVKESKRRVWTTDRASCTDVC